MLPEASSRMVRRRECPNDIGNSSYESVPYLARVLTRRIGVLAASIFSPSRHRDDGKAYHNNCVPLATTRPLNPAQAAQAAPQQAGKLVAVNPVQLGAGRPQNG